MENEVYLNISCTFIFTRNKKTVKRAKHTFGKDQICVKMFFFRYCLTFVSHLHLTFVSHLHIKNTDRIFIRNTQTAFSFVYFDIS